jgi:hypothetical protein
MKLRFDPQASRLEDYPQALKDRLLGIFLDHAEGALRREQGRFREFDVTGESRKSSAEKGNTNGK